MWTWLLLSLQLRQNHTGQLLTQLHAPLIKRIYIPDNTLNKKQDL